LIFTNTRSQAERWYQEILTRRPEWIEHMGLHHGSVDREERERVEAGLKCGALRLVVCTASLDLGVDLTPIERVVQIGSPKGIARLTQRAGRSGHRPGATCRVTCVPTNTFELVEIAAVRDALAHGEVEPRTPLKKPLDALAQHLVTCALGGGFTEEGILAEVRGAWSYRGLPAGGLGRAAAPVRGGRPGFTGGELDIFSPGGKAGLEAISPSRLAPVLKVDGETIWDSMAISVWCAENFPNVRLWPADAHARWLARSAACEMHGGFMALRTECGMGPDHTMVGPDRSPPPTGEGVARDIRRIVALWRGLRTPFGVGRPCRVRDRLGPDR